MSQEFYNRRGQSTHDRNAERMAAGGPENTAAKPGEEPIRVDGFGQVIQMLQVADTQFRESLLRRLAQRDPELARNLRTFLANQ